MFSQSYLTLGMFVFLAAALSGCVTTTYQLDAKDVEGLSQEQARRLLIKTAKALNYACEPINVRATYRRFTYKCRGNDEAWSGRYSDHPVLMAKRVSGEACVSAPDMGESCTHVWHGPGSDSLARDFVRAWYVLNHSGPENLAKEAEFELVAKAYRDNAVKPELPEGAVRRKVQAEAAVREKRFDDAVYLYDEALEIAPWWPAGHYNRGLILGELKDYDEAVDALKRYLKVDPDASSARAVQLKIYEWEALTPQAD